MAIFYTEILTGKVVLWCFFSSETREQIHNSTFHFQVLKKTFKKTFDEYLFLNLSFLEIFYPFHP